MSVIFIRNMQDIFAMRAEATARAFRLSTTRYIHSALQDRACLLQHPRLALRHRDNGNNVLPNFRKKLVSHEQSDTDRYGDQCNVGKKISTISSVSCLRDNHVFIYVLRILQPILSFVRKFIAA